jgi:hypothetical protein
MTTSVKFTISLPTALFEMGEREREQLGLSRSAYIAELYRTHLRLHNQELLLREYESAYRGQPDTDEELAFADAAAKELLAQSD